MVDNGGIYGLRVSKVYALLFLQEMGVYAVYDTSERLQYIGLSRSEAIGGWGSSKVGVASSSWG